MTTTTATPTAAGQTTVSLAKPKTGHHAEGSGGERQHGARAVLTAPGAWPLLSTSIIARLPLAMLSLVLLVHTERVTGSFALAMVGLVLRVHAERVPGAFALAGLVSDSYTDGLGGGAQDSGRIVERDG